MASISATIDTSWSTSNLTASFDINVGWYNDPSTHIIYKAYYATGTLDGTRIFGGLQYSASTYTTNLTIPTGFHQLSVSAANANSGERASWNADIQNMHDAKSGQVVFGYDDTPGSNHIDIVYGSAFGDAFILGQNNDIVEAGGGNDFIDGGAGADRMVGGEGNDNYMVDNLGDVVFEATGEGYDTVLSNIAWTLSTNVEELQLTGSGAINGTGNGGANSLIGNDAANILSGLGGNDTLFGFGGADQLLGGSGNDKLDGGLGADILRGGLGNDCYVVDSASDKVFETTGEGTDTVVASVSYALAAGSAVEQLTAKAGNTAINIFGNEFAQTISGNSGANALVGNGGSDTLLGLGGDDRLFGGAGNDILTGGAGHDRFFFETALTANVDTVTDFNVAEDTLVLDHAIFAALTAGGYLAAGAFAANTTGLAGDASDRVIYETDTGKLFYDANGSAAGGAVQFATVAHDLALTHNDFLVI